MVETFQKQEGPREASKAAKKEAEAKEAEEPSKVARGEAGKKLETEQKAEKKGEEKKTPEKKEEKLTEKKREVVLERVYTFNLQPAYAKPRLKRARTATKLLRALLARHLKADKGLVRLAPEVELHLRARGAAHPARRVKVQASKDREGVVWAKLAA